jgi:hypothetical protein
MQRGRTDPGADEKGSRSPSALQERDIPGENVYWEVTMEGFPKGSLRAVHNRTVSVTTYEAENDCVIVEGVLKDKRLVDTYSVTSGEKMPPGVVHDLAVRITVRGPEMRITDVAVDMKHVPRDDCMRMRESLVPLIGQSVAPGFTQWVKSRLGGKRGCTHLNALVIAMAPAVLQGFWNARAARHMSIREAAKGISPEYLIDTCWVWRSEGPLAEELRSFLNRKEVTDR